MPPSQPRRRPQPGGNGWGLLAWTSARSALVDRQGASPRRCSRAHARGRKRTALTQHDVDHILLDHRGDQALDQLGGPQATELRF